jgi:mRNA interferase MazF
MKQNDIYNAFLDPVIGSEQGGIRPVVIVSGNLINKQVSNVMICPLTTSLKHYEGNPIIDPNTTNGLIKISEVMVFQIRTISNERLKNRVGSINKKQMAQIKETLNKLIDY